MHLYDYPNKRLLQYSKEQKKIIKRIAPFSDMLDVMGTSEIFKFYEGYFLTNPNLSFLKFTDLGILVKKWDSVFPRNSRIKNWDYSFKHLMRASSTPRLSMLNDWSIPIHIELTNKAFDGVFLDDFYQPELFATLDLMEVVLRNFPVRFPDKFYNNGLSYPLNFLPSFMAYGNSDIAYLFGIDDIFYMY